MSKKDEPKGYVIYEGPSLLDGKPIVSILMVNSTNRKTGTKKKNMMQEYIIRSDINPLEANKTGEDFSICGNCIHRGESHSDPKKKTAKKRTCYVNLGQGVLQVYKGYKKGNYPKRFGHTAISALTEGRKVRIGTYGDGGAVPSYVHESVLSKAKGHTAYGHQSNMPNSSHDSRYMMISADTEEQARSAWAKGERTFRVISDLSQLLPFKEIVCPASEEMGYKTTCVDCQLCKGSMIKAKSIAIVVHGTSKNTFKENHKQVA